MNEGLTLNTAPAINPHLPLDPLPPDQIAPDYEAPFGEEAGLVQQPVLAFTTLVPLCVDLDGTLIKTDLLLESFLVLVKTNPLYIFVCCLWLFRGKAYFKAEIAKRVSIDVSLLPYSQAITYYLHEQRKLGRKLYLCTASDQNLARQVAQHLGLFSGVFASDGQFNLSSHNKARVLTENFGKGGFDYIGNSYDDIAVWKEARNAIVVGSNRIAAAAARANPNSIFFEHSTFSLKKTLKAMRVYQWVKNVLIFVPLLTSHQFIDAPPVIASLIAFASFSLCASSVYLLNDMLDLDADRRHERKRNRPFAAGELPLKFGIFLMLGLLAGAVSLALLLPLKVMLVITCYYILTLAYSFKLKKMLLIDVFALASLYTSRVMAGGVAAAISLSSWLIMFSITIFLSLAFVKRYTELDEKQRAGGTTAAGRGYFTEDISILRSFGTSAGYLAVIILAIYLNSPDINLLYSHRSALWGVFALMLFWVSWMWMSAYQGKMHDDPIVFALKNRTSLVTISAIVLCMLIAI
jgi:4-hydroxybenzoate polyprenyltransferase